ncbi:MAG: shikimate dehydrogenase [Actinomycetota bacterium]
MIGNPVRHSLSPPIHNAGFRALDLDWVYVAFDVAPGRAASAVSAMRALHIGGLSVTMPHKADIAASLDRLSPQARVLGAVNCVAWDQGELVGHNTDGGGFVDSLEHETGTGVSGRRCLVVGAGGAARAVVLALAEAGAADVVVVNRTQRKAHAAAELAGTVGRVGSTANVRDADIVVNATSVGMDGTGGAGRLPIPDDGLREGQIVADLVYHPFVTPLMTAARAAGATVVGGVGMLVYQAARQFELWTGRSAPVEAMGEAAAAAIDAHA